VHILNFLITRTNLSILLFSPKSHLLVHIFLFCIVWQF
jgi:hypothetical protein